MANEVEQVSRMLGIHGADISMGIHSRRAADERSINSVNPDRTLGDTTGPIARNLDATGADALSNEIASRLLDGADDPVRSINARSMEPMASEPDEGESLDSVARAAVLAHKDARAEPPKSYHSVEDMCEQAAKHLQSIKDGESDMSGHLRSAAAACINAIAKHHFLDYEKAPSRDE